MKSYPLDDQQHATIIAALRYYQRAEQGEPANRDDWTHDLATCGDTITSLDAEGIDELVEHLHFDGVAQLADFKADFDAKLAAMTDADVEASFKALGVRVTCRPPAPMTDIQKQCWDAMVAEHPGIEEVDEAFLAAVDKVVAEQEGGVCTRCGIARTGVLCGTCAEDAAAENDCSNCGDDLGDYSYEGLCGPCAEREVEVFSRRGMAANPKPPTTDA